MKIILSILALLALVSCSSNKQDNTGTDQVLEEESGHGGGGSGGF